MTIDPIFRTDDVPPAERFAYFRERFRGESHQFEVCTDHAGDFYAYERGLNLGGVAVGMKVFTPARIRRAANSPRLDDPDAYQLLLPLRGTMLTQWDGSQAAAGVGELFAQDFSRLDAAAFQAPHGPVRVASVALPKNLLPLPANTVDRILGRPLPAKDGVAALLTSVLTQLTSETDSYRPGDATRLGTVVLDLVCALFGHLLEAEESLTPEIRRRELTARIQAFIRGRLNDPGLTPGDIAAAHHISVSYLHRLFQAQDTTVGAWIRGQRLERARHDLTDPALRAVPIYRVAERWGFTQPSVFTRAFTTSYGVTPREYRQRALPGAG
ncbi:helix-turn-helix domain-containing protein [Allostreptomyces psammosilenae]|uniref:AraC-like DNA-binding protein n=1 Tax=Allostreptomyces psammosilenae TaxID=1892865 RepID=A0A852ZQM3_9ACTN|nr:helix-turn-helix domain-containing protein [Allostreptomyces psammosilenae]NYI04746.1 AraC-like DNA-binding protein [Allostreptomyces psammosilenae]